MLPRVNTSSAPSVGHEHVHRIARDSAERIGRIVVGQVEPGNEGRAQVRVRSNYRGKPQGMARCPDRTRRR